MQVKNNYKNGGKCSTTNFTSDVTRHNLGNQCIEWVLQIPWDKPSRLIKKAMVIKYKKTSAIRDKVYYMKFG